MSGTLSSALGLLQQAIDTQVGIGVVIGLSSPDGVTIGRIDYGVAATAIQQQQVQQIIANFNTNIQPVPVATLQASVAALTSAQQTTLIQALLAQVIAANPNFAVNLGIPVSGVQAVAVTPPPNPVQAPAART